MIFTWPKVYWAPHTHTQKPIRICKRTSCHSNSLRDIKMCWPICVLCIYITVQISVHMVVFVFCSILFLFFCCSFSGSPCSDPIQTDAYVCRWHKNARHTRTHTAAKNVLTDLTFFFFIRNVKEVRRRRSKRKNREINVKLNWTGPEVHLISIFVVSKRTIYTAHGPTHTGTHTEAQGRVIG